MSLAAIAFLSRSWRADTKQEDQSRIDALDEKVAALQKQLSQAVNASGKAASSASATSKGVALAPRSNDTEGAEANEETDTASKSTSDQPTPSVTDQLDDRFHSEPQDRVWNAAMVPQIRTSVATGLPGVHVSEASCASSLCKVSLQHASADEQRNVALALASREPFRQGVYYAYDFASNPPVTTLYVLRERLTADSPLADGSPREAARP